jgi:hypothetical protein
VRAGASGVGAGAVLVRLAQRLRRRARHRSGRALVLAAVGVAVDVRATVVVPSRRSCRPAPAAAEPFGLRRRAAWRARRLRSALGSGGALARRQRPSRRWSGLGLRRSPTAFSAAAALSAASAAFLSAAVRTARRTRRRHCRAPAAVRSSARGAGERVAGAGWRRRCGHGVRRGRDSAAATMRRRRGFVARTGHAGTPVRGRRGAFALPTTGRAGLATSSPRGLGDRPSPCGPGGPSVRTVRITASASGGQVPGGTPSPGAGRSRHSLPGRPRRPNLSVRLLGPGGRLPRRCGQSGSTLPQDRAQAGPSAGHGLVLRLHRVASPHGRPD